MKTQLIKVPLVIGVLIAIFSACNQEEEYAVNTTTINVNANDSVALSVTPAKAGWVYTSGNNNIASVSAKGIVTGKHVGTTTITVSDIISGFTAQVIACVTAKTTLYREPYPTFFVDELTVRAYETRRLVDADRLTEGISYLLYEAENTLFEGVLYLFSDSVQYFESEVIIFNYYENKVNAHLNDRYLLQRTNSVDFIPYLSTDTSMVVYKTSSHERFINIYTPFNYTGPIYSLSFSLY